MLEKLRAHARETSSHSLYPGTRAVQSLTSLLQCGHTSNPFVKGADIAPPSIAAGASKIESGPNPEAIFKPFLAPLIGLEDPPLFRSVASNASPQ